METTGILLIVVAFIIFLVYILLRREYIEEEYTERQIEIISEYRTQIMTDAVEHVAFWLQIPPEVYEIDFVLTPDDNSFIRIPAYPLLLQFLFNWKTKKVEMHFNVFDEKTGTHFIKKKVFNFKKGMPTDEISNFLIKCENKLLKTKKIQLDFVKQVEKENQAKIQNAFDDAIALAVKIAEDKKVPIAPEVLFEISIKLGRLLKNPQGEKNKDLIDSFVYLSSYIFRHYDKEFQEYVEDRVKKMRQKQEQKENGEE